MLEDTVTSLDDYYISLLQRGLFEINRFAALTNLILTNLIYRCVSF